MRILHFIPVYAPAWQFGGPVQSTSRLCEGLARLGHAVSVFTTDHGIRPGAVPVNSDVGEGNLRVVYYRSNYKHAIKSSDLEHAIERVEGNFDIAHVTAIWHPIGYRVCCALRKARIPYVVSVRGALGRYSWQRNTVVKTAYYILRERKNMVRASGIHYTSKAEWQECAWLTQPDLRCIVPNAVDFAVWRRELSGANEWRASLGIAPDVPILLSVGRLHHKKGLEILPDVLAKLHDADWRMVFIGADEDGTRRRLQTKVRQLALERRVIFQDVVEPSQLPAIYSAGACLLVPSYHENFGNVVGEALACGCPVLVSPGVAIAEYLTDISIVNVVPRNVSEWTDRVSRILRLGGVGADDYASLRGALAGRFETDAISRQMAAFYRQVIRSSTK